MCRPPLFAFLNALLFAFLCVTVHSYAVLDVRSKSAVIPTATVDFYNATVSAALPPSASAAAVPAYIHQKRGNWFSSPKGDTDSFVPQPQYTPRPGHGWFDRLKSEVSSAWNKIWIADPEPMDPGSESSWDTTGGEYGNSNLSPTEPEPVGSEASWDATGAEDRTPDLRPPPSPPLHIQTAPPLIRDERTYDGFGASYDPSPRKEIKSDLWKWKSKGKAPASNRQIQDDPAPPEVNHDASPNQRVPDSPPPAYQWPDRPYGGFGVSYNPPKEPKSHWWQKSKGKVPDPDQQAQDARAPEQRPHDASPNRHKSHKSPLGGVLESLASEPKLSRQNLEAQLANDKDWKEEQKSWTEKWKEINTWKTWSHHVHVKEKELGLNREDRPPHDGMTNYLPYVYAWAKVAPHLVRTSVSAAASSPVVSASAPAPMVPAAVTPPVVCAAASSPMLSTTANGPGSGSSPDDGSGSFPEAGHVLGPIAPAGDDPQSIRSHAPKASSGRAMGLRSRPSRYFKTSTHSGLTVSGGIARNLTTNTRRPHPRLPDRTTINSYTEPIPSQIKNVPQRVRLDDHPPRPARIFREARINPFPHNWPAEIMSAREREKWSDWKDQRPERSDQLAQDRERRTLTRGERNRRTVRKRDLQVPVQESVEPVPVVQPEPVMKPGTVMKPDPVLNPHRLAVSPTQPHPDQEPVKPTQLLPEFLNKNLPNFEMGKEEATQWAIGAILVVLAVILAFWAVSVVLRVVVSSVAGLGNRDPGNKPLLAW